MISLSNTTAQTLTPGQSITFNTVVLHTGCAECHRANTSSVKLRAKGIYDVHFSANIGATVAGAAQLSIQLGGDTVNESTMISTTAAAGDLNNVSTAIPVRNCCDDYDRITVTNTAPHNLKTVKMCLYLSNNSYYCWSIALLEIQPPREGT